MTTKNVVKSKTLVSALVLLVALLVDSLGLPLTEVEVSETTLSVVQLVGLVGVVLGRLHAKTRLVVS